MTKKKKRRNEWHKDGTGRWSRSIGERGLRVRLFQKRCGGPYYWTVHIRGQRVQNPLRTFDQDEAFKLGQHAYAELLQARSEGIRPESSVLTLGDLWRRYSTTCEAFLDNKTTTVRDDVARAQLLLSHFGDDFDVATLDSDKQKAYEKKRLAGAILCANGKMSRPVRARSVEADIVLLHAMLRWATTAKTAGGKPLLSRHPLVGVKIPTEKNKKRPVTTEDRFEATMEWLRKTISESAGDVEKLKWLEIEFALFLANTTGRRLSSIRQLQWSDFDFAGGQLFWRAEADKKGIQWIVGMPKEFADEVRRYQRRFSVVSGPVFPGRNDGASRGEKFFNRRLLQAEKGAQLPKLAGGAWHPYRRKWAIERKHLPLKDVAAAGGWSKTDTLLEVYQQADAAGVLAVMMEPRKLRDSDLTPAMVR